MRDLNTVVDLRRSGFSELDNAWAINDAGQITGVGKAGKQTAYLLTPQP